MEATPWISFFGVLVDRRAYLALLYLLLAMPLGVLYFCFLVTGWSLGLGLLILWVGLLVLLVVLAGSLGLAMFERQQAIWLLGAPVGPVRRPEPPASGALAALRELVTNPVTWKGMLFLLLKFPLGIASFVFAVTAFSLSLALLTAPFHWRISSLDFYWWFVDSTADALLCSLLGALLLVLSLHATRGLGWLWGRLSMLCLARRPPAGEHS